MFFKLLKYDFRSIGRMQVPALLGMLCLTVLGCLNSGVFCLSAEGGNEWLVLLAGLGFFFTAMTLVGIFTVMVLLIYVRFYKSTATDEAYTTFTLPASPSGILGAKFLSASLWYLIVTAVYLLAFILMILTMAVCIGPVQELDGMSGLIWDEIVSQTGIDAGSVILLVVSMVLTSASQILQIFTAILFGSSIVRRYKALAAVGMVFVVNFIVSGINSVFSFAISGSLVSGGDLLTFSFSRTLGSMILTQTILYVLIAVACWFFSLYIIRNRINLE